MEEREEEMKEFREFDPVRYLDNEELIAEYLAAALEDPNPNVFLTALSDVAKARGMTKLANDAGIGRESLYKTLAAGTKPRFETIQKIINALGVSLDIKPAISSTR